MAENHDVELHEDGVTAVCSCGATSGPGQSWDSAYEWQVQHQENPPTYERQVVTWDGAPPPMEALSLPAPPTGTTVEGVLVLQPGTTLVLRLSPTGGYDETLADFVSEVAKHVDGTVVVVTGEDAERMRVGSVPVTLAELVDVIEGATTVVDAPAVAEALLVWLASRGLA